MTTAYQPQTQEEARFDSYLRRNCTAAQIAKVDAQRALGWRAFKVAGTTAAPIVLMSNRSGVRSNIVPGADHARIGHDGMMVRYTPKGR